MSEEWRYIPDYPCYAVSNTGKVFSYKTNKILKQTVSPKGYLSVRLYNEKGTKLFFVHVLVAVCFVQGRTSAKRFVNHKDENKQHNNDTNLEWCSDSYNKLYSAPNNSLSKEVLQKRNNEIVAKYFSTQEAARQTGFTQTMISRACREGCKAYGFTWEYSV